MSEKIAVFYHLMQIKGWEFLYQDQMQVLCSSGLINACDFIHMGINGDSELFWTPPKCKIKRNEILTSEYCTLKDLQQFAINSKENYKILYFHSKGITNIGNMNIRAWRLYMEYCLIQNWKECVNLLDEYDCVGTSFAKYSYSDAMHKTKKRGSIIPTCPPHFSGNFWWTNTEYLKKLDTIDKDRRNYQEFWITSNFEKNRPKIKSFFYTGGGGFLYHNLMSPDKYIKLT